jgi:hypothetical protein
MNAKLRQMLMGDVCEKGIWITLVFGSINGQKDCW